MTLRLAILAGAVLAAAPPVWAQRDNDAAGMLRSLGSGGLTGRKLAEAIRTASAFPLGSHDNPVRADMPEGERDYLRRLRCAGGRAPAFTRTGSVGVGVYGSMLDAYEVRCANAAATTVYMDMYHRHRETEPVPGFTLASDAG